MDWIETEVGFVRASEVAAVIVEDRTSSYFRPSKGHDESIEWRVLLVVTRGGAKLEVRDDRFSDVNLDVARRLVEEVSAIIEPPYEGSF
jgi:hypothetical protein